MHTPYAHRWLPNTITCGATSLHFRPDLSGTSYLMAIAPSRAPAVHSGLVVPTSTLGDLREAIARCPREVIRHVDFLDYPHGAPAAKRNGNILQCGPLAMRLDSTDALLFLYPSYREAGFKWPEMPYECLGHLERVLRLLP